MVFYQYEPCSVLHCIHLTSLHAILLGPWQHVEHYIRENYQKETTKGEKNHRKKKFWGTTYFSLSFAMSLFQNRIVSAN